MFGSADAVRLMHGQCGTLSPTGEDVQEKLEVGN